MVNELHKHYSYNCLTDEQFTRFMLDGLDSDEAMVCDCDECGSFMLPESPKDSNRCECGNRRCYVVCGEELDSFYIEVD